jgi:hypothetical protein
MIHAKMGSGAARRPANVKDWFSIAGLVGLTIAITIAAPLGTFADQRESAAKLLARTMSNPDFRPKSFRGGAWFGSGDSYLALEPSANGAGSDVVRYQTATGAREILVAADRLIPAGEKAPLAVENYWMSPDGHRVLVFTNSKTVWRQNTRGDYWVLDLTSGAFAQNRRRCSRIESDVCEIFAGQQQGWVCAWEQYLRRGSGHRKNHPTDTRWLAHNYQRDFRLGE